MTDADLVAQLSLIENPAAPAASFDLRLPDRPLLGIFGRGFFAVGPQRGVEILLEGGPRIEGSFAAICVHANQRAILEASHATGGDFLADVDLFCVGQR